MLYTLHARGVCSSSGNYEDLAASNSAYCADEASSDPTARLVSVEIADRMQLLDDLLILTESFKELMLPIRANALRLGRRHFIS